MRSPRRLESAARAGAVGSRPSLNGSCQPSRSSPLSGASGPAGKSCRRCQRAPAHASRRAQRLKRGSDLGEGRSDHFAVRRQRGVVRPRRMRPPRLPTSAAGSTRYIELACPNSRQESQCGHGGRKPPQAWGLVAGETRDWRQARLWAWADQDLPLCFCRCAAGATRVAPSVRERQLARAELGSTGGLLRTRSGHLTGPVDLPRFA
jgi:hypothetical protein